MAAEPPLVSVVIRSMDRELLGRALRSIAAQDVESAEVIVVDAKGGHRRLVAKCGPFDIKLVHAGRPLRRAEAANVGLLTASGKYIYFLDDDDEALPGAIPALVQALRDHPGAGLAHGRSEVVDGSGRVLHYYGGPFRREMRLACGFFSVGAFVMSRALVSQGARVDPNLEILEDLEFFAQLSELTDFTYLDQPVHRYWSHAGTSGAGLGANEDPQKIGRALAYIKRKWEPRAPPPA
jgi:glycosyltransferase involved in cell wall biosynthesis